MLNWKSCLLFLYVTDLTFPPVSSLPSILYYLRCMTVALCRLALCATEASLYATNWTGETITTYPTLTNSLGQFDST